VEERFLNEEATEVLNMVIAACPFDMVRELYQLSTMNPNSSTHVEARDAFVSAVSLVTTADGVLVAEQVKRERWVSFLINGLNRFNATLTEWPGKTFDLSRTAKLVAANSFVSYWLSQPVASIFAAQSLTATLALTDPTAHPLVCAFIQICASMSPHSVDAERSLNHKELVLTHTRATMNIKLFNNITKIKINRRFKLDQHDILRKMKATPWSVKQKKAAQTDQQSGSSIQAEAAGVSDDASPAEEVTEEGEAESVDEGEEGERTPGEEVEVMQEGDELFIPYLPEAELAEGTDDIFEAEAILAHRLVRGKDLFHVHWKGYGVADRTWEPAANLFSDGAQTLIKQFRESQA